MNCYNLYSFTLTDDLFSFLVNYIFNSKLSLTFFFFKFFLKASQELVKFPKVTKNIR